MNGMDYYIVWMDCSSQKELTYHRKEDGIVLSSCDVKPFSMSTGQDEIVQLFVMLRSMVRPESLKFSSLKRMM
mgnify:CR=1